MNVICGVKKKLSPTQGRQVPDQVSLYFRKSTNHHTQVGRRHNC